MSPSSFAGACEPRRDRGGNDEGLMTNDDPQKKPTRNLGTRTMSPLWHLTLARFREFYREPAALFWVYGFPLILAGALGLAFSEKPVPASVVDVQADPADPGATEKLRAALAADPGLKV